MAINHVGQPISDQFIHSLAGNSLCSDRLLCKLGGYKTHLPVLKFLIEAFPIKSVIEFGMGRNSTPWLANTGLKLLSIENSIEWFEKSKTDLPNHKCVLWPNSNVQDYLLEDVQHFDLALIDSDTADNRLHSTNRLFGRSRFIVFHDSNLPEFNSRINEFMIPFDYKLVRYRNLIPETAVFTSFDDAEVIEDFCKPVKCLI